MSDMEPHAFEQNPDATQVRVCVCGKWPDHHMHTGDRDTCGCDHCRSARPASPPEGARFRDTSRDVVMRREDGEWVEDEPRLNVRRPA